MYKLLSVPHESEVMSMWKGKNGIFSNSCYLDFTFRPQIKKTKTKMKTLGTKS